MEILITAIINLITAALAFAAFYQSKLSGAKSDTIIGKSNTIITKAEEIHTLTNSNLAKVTADLKLANARIEKLETFIQTFSPK